LFTVYNPGVERCTARVSIGISATALNISFIAMQSFQLIIFSLVLLPCAGSQHAGNRFSSQKKWEYLLGSSWYATSWICWNWRKV